jgi:2C-methyl-D-erythritol 2,4-cyclodiphosphate synthase
VLENSPTTGISLDEMRSRVMLKEQLSATKGDEFLVEEADFKMISQAVKTFPWLKATKELLETLEGIVNSETIANSSLKAPKSKQ